MKLSALIIVMLFTACTDIIAKHDCGEYAVVFEPDSGMSGQVPVVVRISRTDAAPPPPDLEEVVLAFGKWNQIFLSYDSPVTITASEGLLLKSPCCPIPSSHLHFTSPIFLSLKPISHEGAQLFVSRRCDDAVCSVTHSCRA